MAEACPSLTNKHHASLTTFKIQAIVDGDSLLLLEVDNGHQRYVIDAILTQTFKEFSYLRGDGYLPQREEIVAVKDTETGVWHRGLVESIIHENDHRYKIFLIDYGITFWTTERFIARLPSNTILHQKPMCIKFKVFGIIPWSLNMEISRNQFFKPGTTNKYDASVFDFYTKAIDAASKIYICTEYHKHYISRNVIVADLHLSVKGKCFSLTEQLCALEYAYYDEIAFKKLNGLPDYGPCDYSNCCGKLLTHEDLVANVTDTIFPKYVVPHFEKPLSAATPPVLPRRKNRNKIRINCNKSTGKTPEYSETAMNPKYAYEQEILAFGAPRKPQTAEEIKETEEFWAKLRQQDALLEAQETEKDKQAKEVVRNLVKPICIPAGMNINHAWNRRKTMRKVQYGSTDNKKVVNNENGISHERKDTGRNGAAQGNSNVMKPKPGVDGRLNSVDKESTRKQYVEDSKANNPLDTKSCSLKQITALQGEILSSGAPGKPQTTEEIKETEEVLAKLRLQDALLEAQETENDRQVKEAVRNLEKGLKIPAGINLSRTMCRRIILERVHGSKDNKKLGNNENCISPERKDTGRNDAAQGNSNVVKPKPGVEGIVKTVDEESTRSQHEEDSKVNNPMEAKSNSMSVEMRLRCRGALLAKLLRDNRASGHSPPLQEQTSTPA